MDYIDFHDLDYGTYEMSPNKLEFLSENLRYSAAVFNRLYYQGIRLPEGRNNLIFLLSQSFEKDIDMIASGKFQIPVNYKRIFYPIYDAGNFMGRRFRFNNGSNKKNRNSLIHSKTNLHEYAVRRIPGRTESLFVSCADYYNEFAKIMSRFPIKRNYTEFFKELNHYLSSISTPKNDSLKGNQHNNRILVIDADSFAFSSDVSFESAKTNPLFLLYLAFLRNRNLKNLEVNFDMLICSEKMFMKFNPVTCTGKEWTVFKNALFKILKANLDDYTAKLSESEKSEIEETSKDVTVRAVVKKAVSPYTKKLSGATKQVLEDIVEDKLRANAAVAAKLGRETKAAQSDVSREIQKKYMSSPSGEPHKSQFTSPQEKSFRAATNTSSHSTYSLAKPTKGVPSYRQQSLFAKVAGVYQPLVAGHGFLDSDDFDDDDTDDTDEDRPEDFSDAEIDELEDSAKDILVTDEEVKDELLDEIQKSTVPLTAKHAPLNSKRDAKLREAQKKVIVGKESIEEILERDASRIPIQESDKSKVMHTSNPHMKKIRFANFDKTYIDELLMRDIVSAFDFLKDLEYPFYVTDVKVEDSSNALNFKDTWTVTLRDETNKRYTIKVDIPKFQDNRFLLVDGTRYTIMKQNFYNPLVKDTPGTVMVTTNFNKIQMQRRATKSLSAVERIFALMKKVSDSKMFQTGDSTKTNLKYISCLEYDEFSRRLFMFETKTCRICFSRDYIKEHWMSPEGLNGDEFLIGFEGTAPIILNEDTGLDRAGRSISDIIEAHLPSEYQEIYRMAKAPKQSMYVEAKLAGEFLPVITTLCVWVGLRQTLNLMGIKWSFDEKAKRLPQSNSSKKYIRFSNGVLEYEAKTFAELIMNGMAKMHPEKFTFDDFETEAGYGQFVYSQFGTYNGITELRTFHEFLIDPITKQVCKDMMLPDTAAGLLIHGVKLLSDNAFVSKANDNSYRVRSIEIVPAILYNCLARQYKAHVKSGRRTPMTLKQNAVIQELLAQKTVEGYSTLNPVSEMNAIAKISTKGYKGSNSDFSYDEEKRSYDPTSIGKLAMSTDPNAGVGINRQLTLEPTIANARGYREPVDDIEALDDVNVFSGVELMTPGTARGDDPIRVSILSMIIFFAC